MQKIVFCLVAVLALAYAQFPQTGTIVPTPINSTVNTQLGISNNYNTSLNVAVYSLYVPSNTMYVNTTFVNGDYDNCGYINFLVRTHGLPCSPRYYGYEQYLCSMSYNPGDGIAGYDNEYMFAGWYQSGTLFSWEVAQVWYFAVGRYDAEQGSDTACPYQIDLNIAYCPVGQTSVVVNDAPACAAVNNATYGNTYSIVGTQNSNIVYNTTVAQGTGMLTITLRSNSDENYIYGKNYGVPGSDEYNCYTTDAVGESGNYTYTLYCYTPRSGPFYFLVTNTYESYNGTITFAQTVCPSGMAGFNCSFPITQYNISNPNSFAVTVNYVAGYLSYPLVYYYFDIPANNTFGNNVLTLNFANTGSNGDNGYVIVRRDGFPEFDDYYGFESEYERQSTPVSFSWNNFDWQIPGRYYVALLCYSDNQCNFTVGANATSVTSTSGTSSGTTTGMSSMNMTGVVTTGFTNLTGTTGKAVTTGITTSKVTTGGVATTAQHESGVSAVLPSVFLALVAAIVALF